MKILISIAFLFGFFAFAKAQQYKPIDEKSEVKFTIKNFGINTGGSLSGLKGSIKFNPSEVAGSVFNVSVDVNTINTGIEGRDKHLKKDEYFDAEKFSTISFESTNISGNQNGYTVSGKLTIKGVTKNVSFPFKAISENNSLTLTGSFTINRKDFGVGGSSAVLGSDVNVSLKVFAVKS